MLPLWSRAGVLNRLIYSTVGSNHILRTRATFVTNALRGNSSLGARVFNRMVVTSAKDDFVRLDEKEKKKFDVEIKVKAIKIPKHQCNQYLKGMSRYGVTDYCCVLVVATL